MDLKVKKLKASATLPTRGSAEAAGYDLYSADTFDTWIHPHGVIKFGTGLSVEIPKGYYGAIVARSGLATNQGLRPANAVGIIDSDYRGEVIVALRNDSDEAQMVSAGSRIAQLLILPYQEVNIIETEELSKTARGAGGFGSTGIK